MPLAKGQDKTGQYLGCSDWLLKTQQSPLRAEVRPLMLRAGWAGCIRRGALGRGPPLQPMQLLLMQVVLAQIECLSCVLHYPGPH